MIHIIDDLYLDADDQCYMIKYFSGKTRKDNGEIIIDKFRFYESYKDCLDGLLKVLTRRDIQKATTLKELASLHACTRDLIARMTSIITSIP